MHAGESNEMDARKHLMGLCGLLVLNFHLYHNPDRKLAKQVWDLYRKVLYITRKKEQFAGAEQHITSASVSNAKQFHHFQSVSAIDDILQYVCITIAIATVLTNKKTAVQRSYTLDLRRYQPLTSSDPNIACNSCRDDDNHLVQIYVKNVF